MGNLPSGCRPADVDEAMADEEVCDHCNQEPCVCEECALCGELMDGSQATALADLFGKVCPDCS